MAVSLGRFPALVAADLAIMGLSVVVMAGGARLSAGLLAPRDLAAVALVLPVGVVLVAVMLGLYHPATARRRCWSLARITGAAGLAGVAMAVLVVLGADTVQAARGIAAAAGVGAMGMVGLRLLARPPVAGAGSPPSARLCAHDGVKRALDIAGAVALMVLTAPLVLVVAVLVWHGDRGPVLYRQVRVGRGGAPFTLLKFRSMTVDAEPGGRPVWACEGDPRITPVGRLIRATRIDELPQLVNVLRGEMSLVGPRPERPEIVADLIRAIPGYDHRHAVLPGITGWAQVNYRYGASIEDAKEKTRLDLHYLAARSLWLDLWILVRTVGVILAARGR